MKKLLVFFFLAMGLNPELISQSHVISLELGTDSLSVTKVLVDRIVRQVNENPFPIAGFVIDGKQFYSNKPERFNNKLKVQLSSLRTTTFGINCEIGFINLSEDTIQLENVVPFGEDLNRVYITGKGKHGLSRTHLFLPGRQPINVIVPDNAWDLGFCTMKGTEGNLQITGLVRRNKTTLKKGSCTRFETILYPGGFIGYDFYLETIPGDWHSALEQIFQKRMLYDVDKFDNSLFERKDLQWVRHSYVSHLVMNWDKNYYDYADKKFHLYDFLDHGKKLYGGDDFIGMWPTWPTLGLDQRNQFDLFNDLPGGTAKLKEIAEVCRKQGSRFFVCYNPWDESTRNENHFEGISKLVASTSADGMVLDTRGGSNKELQDAADKVRPGVIMYSEGMAVPKDMTGIVSGRVHNALYYPPFLNLNKLIKPEFAIFRVAELYKEPIQREFATAFFNGYGIEMNIMAPGEPAWTDEQYKYLGRTSRILRENTFNFVSHGYTPLIETTVDSIWVNKWELPEKTIFTIYSIRPEGFNESLFQVEKEPGTHFVDLWHHRLLTPEYKENKWMIGSETNAFNKKYLGSNNEGEVDCIAKLPVLVNAVRNGDIVTINISEKGDEIRIWAGMPAYDKKPLVLKPGRRVISLSGKFGRYEGDFVIQLMDQGILLDENIITVPPGEPRRISVSNPTNPSIVTPGGMAKIPAGNFHFMATHGDEFIPYPKQDIDSTFNIPPFFMDKFPVTNAQYLQFVKASGYIPADTKNYLKHWTGRTIPAGKEYFPVVFISYEDAKAFAAWAGKRLPTEIEWQYAAQTSAGNEWPWKQVTPVSRKEEVVTETLTVSSIEGIDTAFCNLGDGKLYPVGKYPRGVNPFGLQDITGCVWQLTNDLYMNGSYRYIIMKGGSYFKPSSSWWYVQGGPRELHYRQYLLRINQGFERNATVGFRCVKDAK